MRRVYQFEDYFVDENGIIYSYGKKNKNLLKPIKIYKFSGRRPFVELHVRGEKKKYRKFVAELVLNTYSGKPTNENQIVVHINNDLFDCSATNLRWEEKKRCRNCGKFLGLEFFSFRDVESNKKASNCKDCSSVIAGYKKRLKPADITLTETQKAYIAGLMDGEGCIRIQKSKIKKTGGVSYVAVAYIGNTDCKLGEICAQVGVGNFYKRKKINVNHKICYIWCLSSNACRSLLPNIVDYLIFKKQQAIHLIEFLENVVKMVNVRALKSKYLTDAEELYKKIKKLNKRGIKSVA